MNTIEVLYKKHGNVKVVINESDFDPELHEKVDGKKTKAAPAGATTTSDDATGKDATSKPKSK